MHYNKFLKSDNSQEGKQIYHQIVEWYERKRSQQQNIGDFNQNKYSDREKTQIEDQIEDKQDPLGFEVHENIEIEEVYNESRWEGSLQQKGQEQANNYSKEETFKNEISSSSAKQSNETKFQQPKRRGKKPNTLNTEGTEIESVRESPSIDMPIQEQNSQVNGAIVANENEEEQPSIQCQRIKKKIEKPKPKLDVVKSKNIPKTFGNKLRQNLIKNEKTYKRKLEPLINSFIYRDQLNSKNGKHKEQQAYTIADLSNFCRDDQCASIAREYLTTTLILDLTNSSKIKDPSLYFKHIEHFTSGTSNVNKFTTNL